MVTKWNTLRAATLVLPVVTVLMAFVPSASCAESVSLRSLLNEMVDRDQLASLVVAFAGGGWDSMGRYVLPLFPIFAAIPLLVPRPARLLALAYLFTIFQAFFAIMFSHWYFVT